MREAQSVCPVPYILSQLWSSSVLARCCLEITVRNKEECILRQSGYSSAHSARELEPTKGVAAIGIELYIIILALRCSVCLILDV